ncbi:hypothetical protein AQUCO_01500325v1 [Aquilegia coerulea]|uniref:Uncharacterized protein n=1 Tax=Aquilegia coerulea TaxID=218851 RepID=A0A2G5DTD6_AQUCA|nr:hypothetical protein AQUCO_01500325v1 [Aquilegia coerulea]
MELLKQLTWKVKKLEREVGEKRRLWRIVFTHYFATIVFTWSVSILEYRCDIKSIYLFLVIIAQMMNLIFFISAWGRLKVFFTILSHCYQVKIDTEGGVVTMVDKMDLVTHWVQLGLVTTVAVLYEVYLGVVAYNCGGQVPSLMTLPFKAFLI